MMLVSAKYLAALALLVYTVAARTTESDASSSAEAVAAAPKVDLEKVDEADNALINALEEEEKAVMDRIDALEDSIKTLTTMDVDKDLDTSINKTAQANVKPVQADKKKKKSKGKKPRLSSYQNYALAQPDTDSPLPVEGEEEEDEDDEEYYDDEEESEEEELPQGDAPSSNSYDLMVSDGYVPDATLYRDYNRGRSNRGRPSALMSGQDKYFDVQPLDDYLKTCTDCYEHTEDNICPLSPVGLELKKWAGELEDILSHGCMKPNDCDLPGTCCLQREGVPVEPTVVRMTQMLKDVFEMVRRNCKNCKGRAEWSEWCAWSGCSATCGRSAVQTRTRKCVHRGPNDGGKPECEGDSVETKPCNLPSCCQPTRWSSWTPWGQCSGSCGMETVTRTRSCQNPNRNTFECPDECPAGSRMETKEVRCGPEPVDSRWGSWTQWNMAVTCGNGMATRSRNCNPGNRCGRECVGDSMEQQFQRGQPCPVCERTGWGEWQSNECSNTCGPGSRLMTRTCRVERRGENGGEACPDNPCSVTSGRFGRPETEEKFEDCNLGDCCEMRQWTSWTSNDECSVTCGQGVVTKRRRCAVMEQGVKCYGANDPSTCTEYDRDDTATEVCNNQPCCVCEVREWTPWSEGSCSATCGSGTRTRTRNCVVRVPGVKCASGTPGDLSTCDDFDVRGATDQVSCNERDCPCEYREYRTWSPWGPCDVTCVERNGRPGTQQRARRCEVVSPGKKCSRREGDRSLCDIDYFNPEDIETRSCPNLPECPIPTRIEYAEWDAWCPCDCSTGKVSRRRACEEVDVYTGRRNPVAVELCLNLGDARETEDCDVRDHCPACINSCESRHSLGDFLPDGNYQSCMGCADYISCRNGQATSFRCDKNGDKEFDAFIKKCVSKSSPSCALREPVTSCRGIADGSYHAKKSKNACQHYATCQDGRLTVNRCPRDMEWNDHAKECQLRRSPTCIRDAEEVITNSIEFSGRFLGVPRNDMPADAPADMFYDEEHGLSPEERRRIYEEERKELELTRAKDAKWEKENPLKASELKLKKAALSGETPKANKTAEMTTTDSVLRRMNPSDVCISGPNACKGLEPGHYASCRGCNHYAVCTKRGRLREKRCPKSREFDNNKRRCVRVSKTCKLQGTA